MTQEELITQIEKDIAQKGVAHVPTDIIQKVLSADTHASQALDAALEEFASNHGWHVRHDALPIPKVIFSPVEGAGKLSEEKEG